MSDGYHFLSATPAATVAPSRIELQEGDTAEFRCSVTGEPTPRVVWTKEGGPLPRDHRTQDGLLMLVRMLNSQRTLLIFNIGYMHIYAVYV